MAGFLERAAAALTPKLASVAAAMRGPVQGLSPGMIVLCFKLLENGRLELRFAERSMSTSQQDWDWTGRNDETGNMMQLAVEKP
jgi:hypothetical protein